MKTENSREAVYASVYILPKTLDHNNLLALKFLARFANKNQQ